MKVVSTKSCPCCKQLGKVVMSNNVLVPGVCEDCLKKLIDYKDLKAVDYFCRTYNIPFVPDKWIKIANELREQSFATYVQVIADEYHADFTYKVQDDKGALWEEVNKMWDDTLTHQELLNQIESIKAEWLKQMQVKWGNQYSFYEYLKLENLFANTVKGTGTTNPLTIDIIKKIAIISVLMDRSLENGDIKEAGEYSKMHQQLIKSAGLEEMIDVNESDTINTVADLCDYLEKKGFKFDFYDNVSRDIVDATIADIKEWTVNFVRNSVGIQQTYEMIEDSFKAQQEQNKTGQATAAVSLDDILEAKKKGINEEIDKSLENEEFELDDEDEPTY